MTRAPCIVLGLVVLGLATVGCETPGHRKPVEARSATIPLKVWVVLAPGETIGDRTNHGCRLTTDEIQDRVRSLQNRAGLFGQNVVFQWQPATPTAIEDGGLLPWFPRSRDWQLWHQAVPANYWQSGHINIYFVGDLQRNGQTLIGSTIDPQGAQSMTPEVPWTAMSDGGYQTSIGFHPDYTPEKVTSYYSILHEMTHYLARFTNRTFGVWPFQRTYDSEEHSDKPNNILQGAGVPPANPLVIPGRWNRSGTEAAEIWNRIDGGNWGNP